MADQVPKPGGKLSEALQTQENRRRKDKIERFLDGDTFDLPSGYRIRIWGVDAPERGQPVWVPDPSGDYTDEKGNPYGPESGGLDTAHRLAAGYEEEHAPDVFIEPVELNMPHGHGAQRVVGRVEIDSKPKKVSDLGRLLVEKGLAVPEPRYSGDAYAQAMKTAQQNKAGYWAVDHTSRFDLPEPGFIDPTYYRQLKAQFQHPGAPKGLSTALAQAIFTARRRVDPELREVYPNADREYAHPKFVGDFNDQGLMYERRMRRRDAQYEEDQ